MKKVVLELDLADEKIKQKAMRRVSGVSGVESIALNRKDKLLTVIGDVDPVALEAKLRKFVRTEIVSVGPANEPEKKKDEPKKEGPKDQPKEDDEAQLRKAFEAYNQQLQHHYYDQKSVSEQEIESTSYGEVWKNFGEMSFNLSEGSKRARNRTLDPVEAHDQDAARASFSAVEDAARASFSAVEDAARASFSAVELQRKNDDLRNTTADLDSASFSDENYDQKKSASEKEIESTSYGEIRKNSNRTLDPVEGHDQDAARASFSAVELQWKNDDLRTTTADLDSASFSDENYDQISVIEQEIESTSYDEIQVMSEMTTSTGAKNFGVWKRDVEFTSSNAEKSMHHQATGFIASEFVQEEKHYVVSMKDDHIKLKLDHQIILIEDCRPSKPPEGSNVEPVLNLVEQDFRELPEKSSYHNALFLFLQRNYRLSRIHSSFFDSMPELRFLDLTDTRIRILPSSLFRLSKLNVLMLRNCASLENLPSEIGKLNQIEVLDLAGTELYNLPNEIGQLTLLKHMQLSFYGPDDESEYDHLPSQFVSPSILSELKELRALSITVHPDDNRWKTDASCIMKDVGKLEMLTYLQLYFPELEMFELFIQTSPSWEKHKLSNFNFIVGHNVKRIASRVPDEVESLFDQQDKCFRFVNGDRVTQVIKNVLIQVTALYLDHHIGIQSLSEFGITNFRVLKFCVLRECPRIQAIVDEKREEGTFPCLEHLRVYYLWDLKHIWKPSSGRGRFKRIWKTSLACVNFKALKHLTVNTCPKLQFVLWESMLQSVSNLEELVVEDCESVEKIIKEEKKKVKHDDVMLPRLRKLELHYLPELVSLGNGLSLPEEIIRVYGCPKLVLK